MRRTLVLVLASCASVLVPAMALAKEDKQGSPNILFILADDLGWSDLGCYGADLHETPHLDRLASQGTRFTQAYAAAAICSPTRASIVTGKYPARLHMTIWHEGALRGPPRGKPWLAADSNPNLPLEHVTLAEVLRDAGYHTWHVGKWHLGDAQHYPPAHGFDLNIGGTHWGAPNTFWHPYTGSETFRNWRYVPDLPFGKDGDYLTDRLTDEAIKLLDRAGDQPFYLQLWYYTVHTPIEGKKDLVAHYRGKQQPGMNHRNPEFAAMVHSLDENVGRLMKALDDKGLADNTIVIFFSDNGGYIGKFKGTTVTSNHPLRSGKGSLYEGGIREPLLVRWPGVTQAGAICAAPVLSTDFYPTLLEIADAEGDPADNPAVDGTSLVPLLRNPRAPVPARTLHWHYPHYYATTTPVSAIRRGPWKLLRYYEDNRLELYNLNDDPGESNNLAEKQPERAQELSTKLVAWLTSVDARHPVPNPEHKPRK